MIAQSESMQSYYGSAASVLSRKSGDIPSSVISQPIHTLGPKGEMSKSQVSAEQFASVAPDALLGHVLASLFQSEKFIFGASPEISLISNYQPQQLNEPLLTAIGNSRNRIFSEKLGWIGIKPVDELDTDPNTRIYAASVRINGIEHTSSLRVLDRVIELSPNETKPAETLSPEQILSEWARRTNTEMFSALNGDIFTNEAGYAELIGIDNVRQLQVEAINQGCRPEFLATNTQRFMQIFEDGFPYDELGASPKVEAKIHAVIVSKARFRVIERLQGMDEILNGFGISRLINFANRPVNKIINLVSLIPPMVLAATEDLRNPSEEPPIWFAQVNTGTMDSLVKLFGDYSIYVLNTQFHAKRNLKNPSNDNQYSLDKVYTIALDIKEAYSHLSSERGLKRVRRFADSVLMSTKKQMQRIASLGSTATEV
jgi:hypothetical protein